MKEFFQEAKKSLKLKGYFYKNFEQDFINFKKYAEEENINITKADLFKNLLIDNNFGKACVYIIEHKTFLPLYLFLKMV